MRLPARARRDLSDAVGGDDEQETCDGRPAPTARAEGSGPIHRSTSDRKKARTTRPPIREVSANDDSGSEEPADDEQAQGDDEQGEDDQGQDEDGASGELDSSDLAAALRFLRL